MKPRGNDLHSALPSWSAHRNIAYPVVDVVQVEFGEEDAGYALTFSGQKVPDQFWDLYDYELFFEPVLYAIQ